jgi:hypothetical protein
VHDVRNKNINEEEKTMEKLKTKTPTTLDLFYFV